MKYQLFLIPAVALALAGCSPQVEQSAPQSQISPANATTAQPVKLSAEQELAKYCRVCVLDDGEKIEEYLPSRLDTRFADKTYKLCSDDCKKKFDADPKKYALK